MLARGKIETIVRGLYFQDDFQKSKIEFHYLPEVFLSPRRVPLDLFALPKAITIHSLIYYANFDHVRNGAIVRTEELVSSSVDHF